jgi:hypothetical protein
MDDQAANIEANTVIEAPPPDIEAPPAAVSVRDLMAWRDSAEDGASLVYHRRHAMKDRAKSPEVDAAVAGAWSQLQRRAADAAALQAESTIH